MTYLMALCPSLLAIKSWQVNVCDGFDLDPLRGEHKLGAELILNTLTLGRFTSKKQGVSRQIRYKKTMVFCF